MNNEALKLAKEFLFPPEELERMRELRKKVLSGTDTPKECAELQEIILKAETRKAILREAVFSEATREILESRASMVRSNKNQKSKWQK